MQSIKIVCLVLCCLQCFVIVRSEIKSQQEAINSTSAEDRKDVQWKKPPRKRGAFSFNYGTSFSPSFHSKSLAHFKKEYTPTLVEKYVPVPVRVKIPVDRPVPVPIKINVPQPYPVYKRVAVPVKVPVDRPVPVQVPKPYPVYVEKQVPYPVDKPVPVPVKIPVDRPYPVYVTVEKPAEKPAEKPMQIRWQQEKPMSMSTGKSMLWFEKPETMYTLKEEPDNEKMVSSWFELPEQSESAEFSWPPENAEFEITRRK